MAWLRVFVSHDESSCNDMVLNVLPVVAVHALLQCDARSDSFGCALESELFDGRG